MGVSVDRKQKGSRTALLLSPGALKFSVVKMIRNQERRMEKSAPEVGRNLRCGALETKSNVARRECQTLPDKTGS